MVYLREGHLPIRSVIFDLANVLVDYDPGGLMKKIGIAPEKIEPLLDIIARRPEWDEYDRGTVTKAQIQELAIADRPDLKDDIIYYLSRWEETFVPLPHNVESFYRLKEDGVKVYILSNWMEDSYLNSIADMPIIADADGIIISYQVGLIKPEPEIFEMLLNHFKIDRETAVFFDDTLKNVETARKVGLHAIQLLDNGPVADFLEFEE